MTVPDTVADLERQLIAAVGWAATLARPIDVDLDLIGDPARRRILGTLLGQVDRHGGAGWLTVADELIEAGDHAAVDELSRCATADGFPPMSAAIVARLDAARDRRRRWSAAVREIEALGGRVCVDDEAVPA